MERLISVGFRHTFTPRGHMKTLPKGATALDFAYDIHTEIGNTCIGAKVNHKLVPMSYRLHTSSEEITPAPSFTYKSSLFWILKEVSTFFKGSDVGDNSISRSIFSNRTIPSFSIFLRSFLKYEDIVISPCCNPIPGDDVVGMDIGGKVTVHKRKCPEAIRLMSSYGDKIGKVRLYCILHLFHSKQIYNLNFRIFSHSRVTLSTPFMPEILTINRFKLSVLCTYT